MPGQFDNPANPEIHEKTTGPEIWNDCDGAIDVLVFALEPVEPSPVSRYIKNEAGKAIESVAVEPTHSPVITQTMNGEEVKPGPHKIQGIGAGFIPKNLDLSVVDKVEQVTNDESIEMALRLAKEEGLLVGISQPPPPPQFAWHNRTPMPARPSWWCCLTWPSAISPQ